MHHLILILSTRNVVFHLTLNINSHYLLKYKEACNVNRPVDVSLSCHSESY